MFDLDGTLVNSLPDLHAATNAIRDALGQAPASLQQVEHWVGNGARMLVARSLSDQREPRPDVSAEQIDAALTVFAHHYREHNGEQSRCYEALLTALREAGIAVAIVTNKPMEFTRSLCANLALEADLIIAGDSLAVMKPDPGPLLHCCDHFGVEPEQALMVGDSINDFAAAKAANIAAIAVRYGYNHGQALRPDDAACVIDSLAELR